MPPEPRPSWTDHPLLILVSRLASIAAVIIGMLGTSVASLAVWVFLRVDSNVEKVSDGFAALATRVSVAERDIANNSANDVVSVKRIGALESRMYMTRGSIDMPSATDRN